MDIESIEARTCSRSATIRQSPAVELMLRTRVAASSLVLSSFDKSSQTLPVRSAILALTSSGMSDSAIALKDDFISSSASLSTMVDNFSVVAAISATASSPRARFASSSAWCGGIVQQRAWFREGTVRKRRKAPHLLSGALKIIGLHVL